MACNLSSYVSCNISKIQQDSKLSRCTDHDARMATLRDVLDGIVEWKEILAFCTECFTFRFQTTFIALPPCPQKRSNIWCSSNEDRLLHQPPHSTRCWRYSCKTAMFPLLQHEEHVAIVVVRCYACMQRCVCTCTCVRAFVCNTCIMCVRCVCVHTKSSVIYVTVWVCI